MIFPPPVDFSFLPCIFRVLYLFYLLSFSVVLLLHLHFPPNNNKIDLTLSSSAGLGPLL